MAVRMDQFIARQCVDKQRMDAPDALTFARQLLKVRTRAFQTVFPEYKALTLVPRSGEVNDTDEAYTYQTYTETGRAELMSAYSRTAPRADANGVEADPQKIKPIVSGYGYSFHEAKISARLGSDLPGRKARAARRAIAQELDRILAYGDAVKTGVNLPGLLTLSGTQTYATPNGASGLKTWASKTPDEIILDMCSMISQVITSTNEIEQPDTLLIPLTSMELIKNKRMGDASDVTIFNHYKTLRPEVEVISWHKLEAAPDSEWTGRRMMAYKRDSEKLEALVPVEFEQLPPDVSAIETVTICHARVGGVVLYLPKSVIYGDGI